MPHIINPALRQEPEGMRPIFLYSTPDGFEDREVGTTYSELVGQLITADPIVKVFEGNRLVHTSEDCGNDPDCPVCKRGRSYIRLVLGMSDWVYQLDLPPSARRGFMALAAQIGEGAEPVYVKLTSTRKESSSGRPWALVEFALAAKEAA